MELRMMIELTVLRSTLKYYRPTNSGLIMKKIFIYGVIAQVEMNRGAI